MADLQQIEVALLVDGGGGGVPLVVVADIDATVDQLLTTIATQMGVTDNRATTWRLLRTGEILEGEQRIVSLQLRHGDRLVAGRAPDQPEESEPASWQLRVIGGPDAGRIFPLPPGATTVGGSERADICLPDRSLSSIQARFEVRSDGVFLADAGSTNGTLVNRQAIGERGVPFDPDALAELGGCLLAIEPAPSAIDQHPPPYRAGTLLFHRPPRVTPADEELVVVIPQAPDTRSGRRIPRWTALIPLVLGAVIAGAAGNALYLLLALAAPVVAAVSVVTDRRSGRAAHEKSVADYETYYQQATDLATQLQARSAVARRKASPDPAELADRAERTDTRLWERRVTDGDFLALCVGMADQPTRVRFEEGEPPTEEAEQFRQAHADDVDVPAVVDLRSNVVGVAGPEAARDAIGRALVLQAACLHSPGDVAIVAVVPNKALDRWRFLQWLPHTGTLIPGTRTVGSETEHCQSLLATVDDLVAARRTEAEPMDNAETEPAEPETASEPSPEADAERDANGDAGADRETMDGPEAQTHPDEPEAETHAETDDHLGIAGQPFTPHVLLLVAGDMAVSTPVLSRILGTGPAFGVTAVVLAETNRTLPGECAFVASFAGGRSDVEGELSLVERATGHTVRPVIPDLTPESVLDEVALALAPLRDIAAQGAQGARGARFDLPPEAHLLDLVDLTEPDGKEITARWAQSADGLPAAIGVSGTEHQVIDLRRDGPHALVAGAAGAGKTELLQTWVASLALAHPPHQLTFVLVDQDGAAFEDCAGLPHVVGRFTELDGPGAARALESLNAELRRREEIIRAASAQELTDQEHQAPVEEPASLVIVVDHYERLKKETPEFVDWVEDIARRGGSLGIHLVLATEHPARAVDDKVEADISLRIALRMDEATESTQLLGRPDAAHITKQFPGRAYVRVGSDEAVPVQTAYVSGRRTADERRPRVEARPFLFSPVPPRRSPSGASKVHEPTDLQRIVAAIGEAAKLADEPMPQTLA